MIKKGYLITILALLSILSIGQQKDTLDSVNQSVIGKWDWIYTFGGISALTLTPESEGYTKSLIIRNNILT